MAPKRKAAAVDPVSDSETSNASEDDSKGKAKKAKKPAAKKTKGPVIPLDPSLPNNTVIPADLAPFPKRADGTIRIAAWNVCGIKASDKKAR